MSASRTDNEGLLFKENQADLILVVRIIKIANIKTF